MKPGTNRRWLICGLLFWVTTANYVDRQLFSNLAPELQKHIGWTAGQYWYMQVAFQAAYAVSLLIGGRMMDLLGIRWGFTVAVIFWGLASRSHALVRSVGAFFLVRVLLGLGEGANFPGAIKTVAEWFPKRERALATGLFNSGSNIGGMLVPIAVAILLPFFDGITIGGHVLGWRGVFLATGVIDVAWLIAWLALYRSPEEDPKVGPEELALIRSDPPEPAVRVRWRTLLRFRQTWAIAAAKGLTDCMWWFYLVGAPPFLADRFHLDARGRALPVSCIYVVASVGSIAGGWLSSHLMKRGWTVNRARKTALLACAVAVLPVFLAASAPSVWLAVGLIALAGAAHQAWSCNVYSLVGDMFPRHVIGSVAGIAGMAGSAGAIVLFIYAGRIRDAAVARGESGDYFPLFFAASVAYLAAFAIVQWLAPRLDPAPIELAEAAEPFVGAAESRVART